ncbi:MAG: aldo/keto reductase [Gammaproteobacteria bacterium]
MNGNAHQISRREVLKLIAATGLAGTLPAGFLDAKPSMIRRKIPSSGEGLPVIGLGTSQVFDVGSDPADRAPLLEVLRLLVDAGASIVDTAPMYGRAQQVIGQLAQDMRKDIFLATKVLKEGKDAGIRQMKESMTYLGTDSVDLMQVHNLVDWKVQLDTLRSMKEEGTIRYLGITHYRTSSFQSLEEIMMSTPLDFVQLNYSLLTPDAEQRLLPLAQDKGIAIMVNRPFERGGVFERTRGKPLPGYAADLGIESWGQFFLKWILGNEAVTCVIPATSKPKHMIDNLAAGVGLLPDAEMRAKMSKDIL